MKKTFSFGKVDFFNRGVRDNAVSVEVEYNEKDGKKVFTACGNIWNSTHRDIVAGGQCLDTIAEYIKDEKFLEIYRLWKLYHLNDMHPECEHQAELGWAIEASQKINLYHYKLKKEFCDKKQEAEKAAVQALKNGEVFIPTKEQTEMANLSMFLDGYESIQSPYYELYKSCIGTPAIEEKIKGWVNYGEGKNQSLNGVLGKPCPVCGYKYGTAWNYVPIPEQDEKIIYSLFDGTYKV